MRPSATSDRAQCPVPSGPVPRVIALRLRTCGFKSARDVPGVSGNHWRVSATPAPGHECDPPDALLHSLHAHTDLCCAGSITDWGLR